MDFMFRIPRTLFSILLLAAFGPLLVLIYADISNSLTGASSLRQSWLYHNADTLIFVGIIAAIFVHIWFAAVILRQYKTELKALLLAFPSMLSALLFAVVAAAFLRDNYQITVLPNAVFDYLGGLISFKNIEEFLIGSLLIITIATIISIISMVKLVGRRKLDWCLIPLQVLFLPIGIWWLQPKLETLTKRKGIDAPEDHFVG